MGCWNGTCGISQLPILAGQKVKAFLMLQSRYNAEIGGAGVCYSTAYFRPWFFPVTADYNDYGSIENIKKDWNSEFMLKTFRKWLMEGKVRILGHDEAEINSPDIKKFKTLDDVFDCVERGALLYKHLGEKLNAQKTAWEPQEDELRIGIFMVLDHVFDALVAESNRFLNLKENSYYNTDDVENEEKFVEAVTKVRLMTAQTEQSELKRVMYSIPIDMLLGGLIVMYSIPIDMLLGGLIEEHYALQHYKSILFAPDKVTVGDFISKLNETRRIGTAMSYLRKIWIPQTGRGSQSEELSFNKALIAAMQESIAVRDAEIEQYAREEAEEEAKDAAEEAAKKAAKKKK